MYYYYDDGVDYGDDEMKETADDEMVPIVAKNMN